MQITRTNPQIYYRGRAFKVPTHLVGEHQLATTETGFTLFSTLDGEESLYFPLPLRVASSKKLMPLWPVHGARIREPKPAWILKQINYEKQSRYWAVVLTRATDGVRRSQYSALS